MQSPDAPKKHLSRYWWRYRWHGLAMAAGISLAGWVAVAIPADVFRATAQIYINTDSSMETLRDSLPADNLRFTAADLARKSASDRQRFAAILRAAGPERESAKARDDASATDRMLRRIDITSSARWDNLFRVSFTDPDRRRALAVVEAFVAAVAEEAAGNGNAPAGDVEKAATFRIIEPPNVVAVARPPERPAWIGSIFLVALAIGFGFAVRLSLRTPVVNDGADVAALANMPALVVSHARMPEARAQRRRQVFRFAGSIAALVLACVIVLVLLGSTEVPR